MASAISSAAFSNTTAGCSNPASITQAWLAAGLPIYHGLNDLCYMVSNSTAGCLSTAQIDPDYLAAGFPIDHDPSGICYQFNTDGTIRLFAHYGYNPKLATGIVFIVLFGILMLLHLGFAIKDRRYWLLITAFGAAMEVGGWVGRALSGVTNDASNASGNYFLIQICLLTIAPVFYSGTCYGLLVVLINKLDASLSRVTPRHLTYFFVTCDIVSLILQAAGGALTSEANTQADQNKFTKLFTGGIAFQLAVMVIFVGVGLDYYLRLRRLRRSQTIEVLPGRLAYLAYGIAGASLAIIIRGAYRTAELSEGWNGFLIVHESYFLGLDGAMMLLCLTILAVTHTLFTCPKVPSSSDRLAMEEKGASSTNTIAETVPVKP